MPDSFEFLGSRQAIEALEVLAQARTLARAVNPVLSLRISEIIVNFDRELAAIARNTGAQFVKIAQEIYDEKRLRPETDRPVHLRDQIRFELGPLGSIWLAPLETLDQAVNPEGWGPYWRAQEYGSLEVGNEMTGRIIFGRFYGPDHDDVPRKEFGGGGGGPGSEFVYGHPDGGLGEIQAEIEGKHFLEGGADAAFALFVEEISRASVKYATQLNALPIVR